MSNFEVSRLQHFKFSDFKNVCNTPHPLPSNFELSWCLVAASRADIDSYIAEVEEKLAGLDATLTDLDNKLSAPDLRGPEKKVLQKERTRTEAAIIDLRLEVTRATMHLKALKRLIRP